MGLLSAMVVAFSAVLVVGERLPLLLSSLPSRLKKKKKKKKKRRTEEGMKQLLNT